MTAKNIHPIYSCICDHCGFKADAPSPLWNKEIFQEINIPRMDLTVEQKFDNLVLFGDTGEALHLCMACYTEFSQLIQVFLHLH